MPFPLLSYIEKPESLGAEQMDALRAEIHAHPYCAAYRVLYAIATGNVHSMQLPQVIEQTAAYVPDRFRLMTLTNQGEAEWVKLVAKHDAQAQTPTEEQSEPDDGGFGLIDRYLCGQALTLEGDQPMYDATAALSAIEAMPDAPDDEEPEETHAEANEQDTLIDSFIEAEQQGTLFVPDTPQQERHETEMTVEKIRDGAFLTESLAKIYIKQHKYAQALSIIRDLSLKYPEKNIYFADQIRFLEKIIDFKTNKNN